MLHLSLVITVLFPPLLNSFNWTFRTEWKATHHCNANQNTPPEINKSRRSNIRNVAPKQSYHGLHSSATSCVGKIATPNSLRWQRMTVFIRQIIVENYYIWLSHLKIEKGAPQKIEAIPENINASRFVGKHKQPMSAKFNMMDTKITNTVNRLSLRGANQLTGN